MDVQEIKEKIRLLEQQKSKAIEKQEYVLATDLRDEILKFENQLKNISKR
ncbi:UvrB/UvrC motif-containing protein [Lishizhenia tianjinensis]|nr:UvrB/UvrC motif-containing protein [Lishizhenia tianjinensis]